jgi:tight adherence protein C
MTLGHLGAMLGFAAGVGGWLVVARVGGLRRPSLESRMIPYLRDLPQVHRRLSPEVAPSDSPTTAAAALLGPGLRRSAAALEQVMGGAAAIRRKLERAGADTTLEQFRVSQVTWGLAGFCACAALGIVSSLRQPGHAVGWLIVSCVAGASGVILRDNRLSSDVRRREERILAEFPTVADLLALSVAAGEGATAALERVVRTCRGELSKDLSRVLAESRTGSPMSLALDGLARRSGLPVVARFAEGFAVALERGTPLADVLHSQAADVREAGRRALIEAGARKEVAMMVPVVFLVLPVTVLFAFWPGLIGLRLVAP